MTSSSPPSEVREAPSDEELLADLHRSTAPYYALAWQRFVTDVAPDMHAVLRAVCPADVFFHDDWVQDVTIKLMLRFPGRISGGWNGVRKYAVTSVLNHVRDHARGQKVRAPHLAEYVLLHENDSHAAADAADDHDDGETDVLAPADPQFHDVVLTKLNPIQRTILLAILATEPNETLANRLGLTVKQLAKQRENLCKRLDTIRRKRSRA